MTAHGPNGVAEMIAKLKRAKAPFPHAKRKARPQARFFVEGVSP